MGLAIGLAGLGGQAAEPELLGRRIADRPFAGPLGQFHQRQPARALLDLAHRGQRLGRNLVGRGLRRQRLAGGHGGNRCCFTLHGGRRLLHIHENRPGVLTAINQIFAAQGINIAAQYLQTSPEIGYVVIDVETDGADTALQLMKSIPGTIRARLLY